MDCPPATPIKAEEDRRHLHQSVEELRLHLRETLDVTKNTMRAFGTRHVHWRPL
jgi:hypothetical protein